MFCEKCGQKLSNEADFCSKCGNKIPRDRSEKSVKTVEPKQESVTDNTAAVLKKYYFRAGDSALAVGIFGLIVGLLFSITLYYVSKDILWIIVPIVISGILIVLGIIIRRFSLSNLKRNLLILRILFYYSLFYPAIFMLTTERISIIGVILWLAPFLYSDAIKYTKQVLRGDNLKDVKAPSTNQFFSTKVSATPAAKKGLIITAIIVAVLLVSAYIYIIYTNK